MQHRQLIDFAIDFYSFAINTVGLIINFSSRGFSVMKSLFHADQDRLYELELTLAALEREQIRTIDASYVIGELVDYLTRDDMAQVEHGLSRYFGLLH